MCLCHLFSAKTARQLVNRKADFFYKTNRFKSIRTTNWIDSNRELECSSAECKYVADCYSCSVVCVCVSLLDIIVNCAKTAQPIEMLFGEWCVEDTGTPNEPWGGPETPDKGRQFSGWGGALCDVSSCQNSLTPVLFSRSMYYVCRSGAKPLCFSRRHSHHVTGEYSQRPIAHISVHHIN